jgi:hypothetical protein
MRSPAAKSRAPGSCRHRRRGERHRRHASHVRPSGVLDSIGTTDWYWSCCAPVSRVRGREELRQAKARRGGPFGDAVMHVAAHGAYLNGWRNASPALAPGTQKTSRLSSRLSATTIRVLPASRFHSSETVKPASWRVSSFTNTIGSFLASVISSVKTETLEGTNSALPGPRPRPCHCWVRHGDRPLVHRVAARRSHWSAPSTQPAR